MVWVRVQVPARALFSPALSWVGWGFVAERRPARLRFAFLPCGARVPGWRAWWVGWRFGRLLRIFLTRCVIWDCCALWLLAPSGSPCGVLRGVETLVRALGCLRRASPREARTARFSWAFGSYGGRAVLRGFCGGVIFLLSWLCPWLVARLQGRVFS